MWSERRAGQGRPGEPRGPHDDTRGRERRTRNLIYLLLLVLLCLGLVFPWASLGRVSEEAMEAYDLIATMKEPSHVLLLLDYAGSELNGQLLVLVRHVLRAGGDLVLAALRPEAAQEAERALRQALAEVSLAYGERGVHLGYRPGGEEYAFSLGLGFQAAAQYQDHAGEELWLMPLMHEFRRLSADDLLIVVGDGGVLPPSAAARMASRYGTRALVAASGPTGQDALDLRREERLDAVLPDARALSDYEALYSGRGSSARMRTALSYGVLFMVLLIVVAYLSGWLGRRRGERGGERVEPGIHGRAVWDH